MNPTDKNKLSATMQQIGSRAKYAASVLATTPTAVKNKVLEDIAATIRNQQKTIATTNQQDLALATQEQQSQAFIDRLSLDKTRILAMADSSLAIAKLPDPVGVSLASWEQPNGLKFNKISVPLGVIGVIYESRPNVTLDAAALCIKSGNAVILRCGTNSFATAQKIVECIHTGLKKSGLPPECVQLVPTSDRSAVSMLLSMDEYIDVIIPRGGKSLIERVSRESRIPLFKHLEGICHTYVHKAAAIDMAVKIVNNAKMRRTGICGATETLLIDQAILGTHLIPIVDSLNEQGCEMRGDAAVTALDTRIKPASESDWNTEYLDAIISIKTVANIIEAINHIRQHGSSHTDAIVTNDPVMANKFLAEVDSAIVMHNTSTQFADGGEFGMGGEMGIATGKLHARGPVGLTQLTTFKYQVMGEGQVRT